MRPFGNFQAGPSALPIVTYALIAINVIVFLYEVNLDEVNQHIFTLRYGLIPAELTTDLDLMRHPVGRAITQLGVITLVEDVSSPAGPWASIFTSMFVHAGVFHLAGNMIFLWLLGEHVEAKLGRLKYLSFFLLAGAAGSLIQVATDTDSLSPLVGASGAIAGVMGAYVLSQPRGPGVYYLGFWFFYQLIFGVTSLGPQIAGTGGVAYFAHIGGFLAGLVVMALYKLVLREPLLPPRPGGFYRF